MREYLQILISMSALNTVWIYLTPAVPSCEAGCDELHVSVATVYIHTINLSTDPASRSSKSLWTSTFGELLPQPPRARLSKIYKIQYGPNYAGEVLSDRIDLVWSRGIYQVKGRVDSTGQHRTLLVIQLCRVLFVQDILKLHGYTYVIFVIFGTPPYFLGL